MKILIVNKFLHPNGGSETYIFEIGRCLTGMGHEVQYFGMDHKGRAVGNRLGIYTRDMDFHGSGLRGKLSKLLYPFKIIHSRDAARRITKLLEDFEPDVVHFNNINFQLTPSVIEAVADYDIRHRKQTKTVYTAHDSQWVCPNHLLMRPDGTRCFDCEGCRFSNCIRNRCIHGSLLRSILGALEGWYYQHKGTYELIDTIIAPSEFMKKTLESNERLKGKCVVLHNFVPGMYEDASADRDRSDSAADNECSHADRCDDSQTDGIDGIADLPGRYVLYFGRYSSEKGISTLLDCVKKLPEISFIFAGSGPLEEEVNRIPNIKNVGFKTGNDLSRLISQAAFSVFPSECHENCSFTVMESISYGTPVIASDTGGTPELVGDGLNGMLFNAGDADALIASIRALWDDSKLEASLTKGCMDTHFQSVREYCENLIALYEAS